MARWEHIPCGTVVEGRVPPDNCTFCIAKIVYGTELGWRNVTGTTKAPKTRKKKRKRRPIPAARRKRVYERDGYRCVQCGLDGSEDPDNLLTLDHWIPWSKGGTDDEENLRTMCGPCNTEKADEVPA